ncbi:hypothetical protein SDC9_78421 [bioreactor metagenome]|uniref:Uncharacterized protein n=1 Tax=bioreactor metagenome TaxID=1076179 RepID=A0A644Z0Z2_9ZZZZ
MVIETGGGPGEQQFAHGGERGPGNHLLVQVLPHLVEGDKPGKEFHALHLGQVAGKALVEVMVGVDEAWVDRHVGSVDHLVGLEVIGADILHRLIADENIASFVNRVVLVAGNDIAGVFNKQRGHCVIPFPVRSLSLCISASCGSSADIVQEIETT